MRIENPTTTRSAFTCVTLSGRGILKRLSLGMMKECICTKINPFLLELLALHIPLCFFFLSLDISVVIHVLLSLRFGSGCGDVPSIQSTASHLPTFY